MVMYRIGMVQGAALEADGKTPQKHGISRLVGLNRLLYLGIIDSAIISGGPEAKHMSEYCIEDLGFPKDKLEVNGNSWSIVSSLYNFSRNNRRDNVELHCVIQKWAGRRTEFDASWILPSDYSYIVHGVPDGREKSEVLYDINLEETNIKIDTYARTINHYSKIRPDYAQVVATVLVSPRLAIQRFSERIWPLRK